MSSGLALEGEGGRWKQYPAYRDSGMEWLGAVPEGWEVKRLKNCVKDLVGGGTPDTGNSAYWSADETGIAWVAIADMTKGDTIYSTKKRITREGLAAKQLKILPSGTLLYSMYASLGKVAVLGIPAVTNQAILGILFSEELITRDFLKRWFEHMERHVVQLSSSNTQDNLNAEKVKNIPLFHPPLPEQRAIAAFLDRETGRIDALIAKKERQIELLRAKRAALISHAVTKGLDPDALMKDSGVRWLGAVPEHWESVRLKWVAKMESGHTPNKKVPEYWTNCDIPWVSLNDTAYLREHDYIEDTNYRINELGLANSSARLLPSRAVVFTRDATIGLSAITTCPMAVSQHIIAWLCEPRIVPEYLLRVFYAMTQEFERLTMGSTIKTIGMPDVNELKTPVPPLDEQIAIVKYVLGNTDRIDMVLVAVLDSINLLREYRTALISAAVTGKIDVREELVS